MSHNNSSRPLGVGIVGCGNICNAYFHNSQPYPDLIKIVSCADIDLERAKAKATEHKLAKGYSVKELLEDPEVDIVLNLTIPAAHATINDEALKAGKHVYCEKPLGLVYKEALKTMEEARKRNLKVGCAPDTVLGGGIQTCRKLIDDGAIGKPIAATANMLSHSPDLWHPNPDFFFQPGAGPLFDMGPYYLTSLVTMLGPVKSVTATAATAFKQREVGSGPLKGQKIEVRTPTHLCGLLEFVQGTMATMTMSFDVWGHHQPMLEIYGTESSLQCPDPNNFNGEVQLYNKEKWEWVKTPLTHNDKTGRGLGVADLADAIRNDRAPRASGELGLHIVEIMESFLTASASGRKVEIESRPPQPEPLAPGLPLGKLA
jgi:predicted dehydrogenase